MSSQTKMQPPPTKTELMENCSSCRRQFSNRHPVRCTRCGITPYCSMECATSHAFEHSSFCILARPRTQLERIAVHAVSRIAPILGLISLHLLKFDNLAKMKNPEERLKIWTQQSLTLGLPYFVFRFDRTHPLGPRLQLVSQTVLAPSYVGSYGNGLQSSLKKEGPTVCFIATIEPQEEDKISKDFPLDRVMFHHLSPEMFRGNIKESMMNERSLRNTVESILSEPPTR